MPDKQWSSKLVHKEGKNFFIRTIKLNPFPTYLNVIIVKSTMQRWYDYLVKEKNIDIWQKLTDINPDGDDEYDERDIKLVEDFLNNDHNDDTQVSSRDGGACILSPKGNQWFMLIKEHDTAKKCLITLVHETQHVIQRLAIEYNINMSIWATTEIFSYMTDMIFGELFDDIAKQYSLF